MKLMSKVNAGLAAPLLLSIGELWPSVAGKIARPRRRPVDEANAQASAAIQLIDFAFAAIATTPYGDRTLERKRHSRRWVEAGVLTVGAIVSTGTRRS
jgi:hypothetical protein